jgi:hypothetical protein
VSRVLFKELESSVLEGSTLRKKVLSGGRRESTQGILISVLFFF